MGQQQSLKEGNQIPERIQRIKRLVSNDNVLCHYTSFSAAKSIVESLCFRFSKPLKLNDINESARVIVSSPDLKLLKKCQRVVSQVRQISLTENGRRKCYDISAMWGHYGKKGRGACILFDKTLLLSTLPKASFLKRSIHYSDIGYRNIDLTTAGEKDIIGVLTKNQETVFFSKTRDWAYEQEYRIVRLFDKMENLFIDIPHNSIIGVILQGAVSSVFSSKKYLSLLAVCHNIPIVVYDNRLLDNHYSLFWQSDDKQIHDLFYDNQVYLDV